MLDWDYESSFEYGPDEERREFCDSLPLISPREIDGLLIKHGYVGQDEARRAVSLMAYRHVRRLKRIYVDNYPLRSLPPKQNTLLIGPTGCGKTYIVELLFQQILQIPTVVIDITSFTESGYVGDSVQTILTRLIDETDGQPHLASCGVICLDEFDKLAASTSNTRFAGQGTTKDVSGYGVQRELLKIIEGTEVMAPMDYGYSEWGGRSQLSTRNIPFVACGVFPGLIESTEARSGMGFAADKGEKRPDSLPVKPINSASFNKFGFLPELIGRFSRVVHFSALESETLKQILRQNVLPRYIDEFRGEGLKLSVTPKALDHIVTQAQERETGARGLEAELLQILEKAAYDTFLQDRRREVKVTVKGGQLDAEVID